VFAVGARKQGYAKASSYAPTAGLLKKGKAMSTTTASTATVQQVPATLLLDAVTHVSNVNANLVRDNQTYQASANVPNIPVEDLMMNCEIDMFEVKVPKSGSEPYASFRIIRRYANNPTRIQWSGFATTRTCIEQVKLASEGDVEILGALKVGDRSLTGRQYYTVTAFREKRQDKIDPKKYWDNLVVTGIFVQTEK
jgi:hypothetical protein